MEKFHDPNFKEPTRGAIHFFYAEAYVKPRGESCEYYVRLKTVRVTNFNYVINEYKNRDGIVILFDLSNIESF